MTHNRCSFRFHPHNGKKLFEFLSYNLSVEPKYIEFGLIQTGVAGAKGRNYVTSGSVPGREPRQPGLYVDRLQNGYNIRTMSHSHPLSADFSKGDSTLFNDITKIQRRNGYYIPTYYIYNVKEKRYRKY